MCEYCNLKQIIGEEMNIGKEFELSDDDYEYSHTYVCRAYEDFYLLYIDYEDEYHYIPISHCPKCGRKLSI